MKLSSSNSIAGLHVMNVNEVMSSVFLSYVPAGCIPNALSG